jgi:hypothetical protein
MAIASSEAVVGAAFFRVGIGLVENKLKLRKGRFFDSLTVKPFTSDSEYKLPEHSGLLTQKLNVT